MKRQFAWKLARIGGKDAGWSFPAVLDKPTQMAIVVCTNTLVND
jgi:hypothetical protein